MTAAADHARNADVLDDAAGLIERDGWHQGNYYHHDEMTGAVCAHGAINRVMTGMAMGGGCTSPAVQGFQSFLSSKYHLPSGMGIGPWNDAPGRTAQEVLDALRLAAKSERTRADALDAGGVLTPDDTG